MVQRTSPTVRRRRLSKVLVELREAAGLKPTEVERRLEWPVGKINRTEGNKWKLPSKRDVFDLLDLYGVDDPQKRAVLKEWVERGREKDEWQPDERLLGEQYSLYLGMELEARKIRTYNTLVPGLLQTEETARAIMADAINPFTPAEIEKRVEVRMSRQKLLTADDPLQLFAILDESVLHRRWGGAVAHEKQIEHLVEMSELPNVTLYLLPTSATETAALSGFSILEWPREQEQDWDAVFVQVIAGQLVLEEGEAVRTYRAAFDRLLGAALDPPRTLSRFAGKSE